MKPPELEDGGRYAMRCQCGSTNWMIYASGEIECTDCEAEPECPTRGLIRLTFPEAEAPPHSKRCSDR